MSYLSWFRHGMAVAVLAIFCGQVDAQNDPITTWAFEINTPPGLPVADSATSPPGAADFGTGTVVGVHASSSSDWTLATGNGSPGAFNGNGWALGDYWQFQTSTTGITDTDFGFLFDQVSSSTGPQDFQLSYSLNGTSFTNIGDQYSVRSNSSPNWNQFSVIDLDQYAVDLASISATISNQPNVYFRMTQSSADTAGGGAPSVNGTNRIDNISLVRNFEADPPPPPELPIAGDLVLGLGLGTEAATLELLRGDAIAGDGEKRGSPWTSNQFIRSVEFDNLGGTLHNVQGNLLGVDEGTATLGGTIYSFATQGNPASLPAGQAIASTPTPGDYARNGTVDAADYVTWRKSPSEFGGDPAGYDEWRTHYGESFTGTRLSGLSVAPDNSKIAVAGMDTGKVIVFDYTAGNSMGTGASTSDRRDSAQILDPFVLDSDPVMEGNQSLLYRYGTTWLDDNTVLAFNRDGELHSVNATTMATTLETTVGVPLIGSEQTALTYNPDVSPYVYAMYSGFNTLSDPQSRTRLFILDPADDFNVLGQSDLTDMDLVGATGREIALDADGNLFISTFASDVYFIDDVVTNPASIASPVSWYDGVTFATHTGMDIGLGPAVGGSGGVPEPTGFVMMAIGLAALCFRRRGA